MQTRLGKWGNSTGLRIPAELLVFLGGDKNARVEISGLPTGGLLVMPVAQAARQEDRAALLDALDALHADLPAGHVGQPVSRQELDRY